jgi:hypothetical protein
LKKSEYLKLELAIVEMSEQFTVNLEIPITAAVTGSTSDGEMNGVDPIDS